MRTNIEIDDEMMAKVMKFMGTSTKRETIDRLLRDKLYQAERIKKQQGVLRLAGKIEFDEATLKEVYGRR
jgi:Arc/MetJ family transcription regulator